MCIHNDEKNIGSGRKACLIENTLHFKQAQKALFDPAYDGTGCYVEVITGQHLHFYTYKTKIKINSANSNAIQTGIECAKRCNGLNGCIMFAYDMVTNKLSYRECNMTLRHSLLLSDLKAGRIKQRDFIDFITLDIETDFQETPVDNKYVLQRMAQAATGICLRGMTENKFNSSKYKHLS